MKLLSKQQQEDLLITALEGGSNYWYYIDLVENPSVAKVKKGLPLSEHIFNLVQKGESITINDAENEDEVLGTLNLDSIQKGTELMQSNEPEHFTNILEESWDAETADVWFQYCILGEITFG